MMNMKQEGNAVLQASAHIWSARAVGENYVVHDEQAQNEALTRASLSMFFTLA